MKQIIRFLIIGVVLGGAFGAKLGAYFSETFIQKETFQLVEYGFVLGASIGLFISLIIQVVSSGAFQRQNTSTETIFSLKSAIQS